MIYSVLSEYNPVKLPEASMSAPTPNRWRLMALLVTLALVTIGGWVWYWSYGRRGVEQARPQGEPASDNLFAEEARAKALSEYTELKRINSRRPLGDQEFTRALELAHHQNYWVRLMALGVLTNAPPNHRPAVVAQQVDALHDTNLHVRLIAMHHIGDLGAKDRIADVLACLDSPSEDERAVAKHVLQRLGHPIKSSNDR